MPFRNGKQELLILLLDLSASMYFIQEGPDEDKPTNKHSQVLNCINSLLERISKSNKCDHILISVIGFASNAILLNKLVETEGYYSSAKYYMKNNTITDFVNKCRTTHNSIIGDGTSIISAFEEAKLIVEDYCNDNDIAPENKRGITVMLFTDGNDNCNSMMITKLNLIVTELKNMYIDNSTSKEKQDNFSVCCIAIGNDADQETLATIASPISIKLSKHINNLSTYDNRIRKILTVPHKCYLKINTIDNNISESEISILRKLLFLVTETAV